MVYISSCRQSGRKVGRNPFQHHIAFNLKIPNAFNWGFSQHKLLQDLVLLHRSPQQWLLQDRLCSSWDHLPRLCSNWWGKTKSFCVRCLHSHHRGARRKSGLWTHLPKLHVTVRLSDYPQVCFSLWAQSIAGQLDAVTLTSWCAAGTWQPGFGVGLVLVLVCFLTLWNRWLFFAVWNLYANNEHLHLSPSHKQNWRTLCFHRWDRERIHLQIHPGSAGLAQWGEKSLSPKKMCGATCWQRYNHADDADPQSPALGLLKARPGMNICSTT